MNNGCWVWDGYCDPYGYGEFSLYGSEISAHRASWLIHNGAINSKLQVLHKCDNPPCVNPDHLFLGTHSDNMGDKVRKGRAFVNDTNRAKLNAADVAAIRESAERAEELAERYGVHATHIRRVRRGVRWSHL